jgi:hypothetical protein
MTITPRLKIFALCCTILWTLGVFVALWPSFLDDAYIGFTYIRNFINGSGFVFNPGERIEGITNIGWLLFLLVPACILPIPIAAKITSLFLVIATLAITYRIARELSEENDNGLLAIITVLCTAASFDFMFFAFSGMETSLLAFLLTAVLLLILRHHYTTASAIMAAAFCVRPETLPIAPLWLLSCALFRTVPLNSLKLPALVFSVIIAAIELGRFLYFGEFLPNTFTAKPTTSSEFLARLSDLPARISDFKNISQPFSSLLVCHVMGAGLWILHKKGHKAVVYLLGLIVGAGFLFGVYARQDWTGLGRYFAPYIPSAFLLLTVGGILLIRLLPVKTMTKNAVLLGAFSALIFTGLFDTVLTLRPKIQELYPWYVAHSRSLVPAAKWIEKNTPDDACIAARRIGCLSYYGKRYVFDYKFGLTDTDVAQLIAEHHQTFNSPTNPALDGVWRKRQPDYVLEDSHIIKPLNSGSADTSFVIHGMRYVPVKKFRLNSETDWVLCKHEDTTSKPGTMGGSRPDDATIKDGK